MNGATEHVPEFRLVSTCQPRSEVETPLTGGSLEVLAGAGDTPPGARAGRDRSCNQRVQTAALAGNLVLLYDYLPAVVDDIRAGTARQAALDELAAAFEQIAGQLRSIKQVP